MSFLMKWLSVPSKVCTGGPYLRPTTNRDPLPGIKQVQPKETDSILESQRARLAWFWAKNPGKCPHLGCGWNIGTTTVPFNCTSRNVASETQMLTQ